MQRTIDVSGLSPESVRAVEVLVAALHRDPTIASGLKTYWPGPPPGETAEEWTRRLREWIDSHPKRAILIDDSRETIYAGRGE